MLPSTGIMGAAEYKGEAMVDQDDAGTVPAAAAIAALVAVSCALAGSAAVAVVLVVGAQPAALAAAVLVATVVGLLATAMLQRNLYLLGLALARLGHGLPMQFQTPRAQWPLGTVFANVTALGRLLDEQVRREEETTAYRAQLLERVGAAAAQEERNRLAHELHDSIKQQIFSISMSGAAAEARWESDPTGALAAVADVRRSAQEALVEMQALLQELGPGTVENVGLREAVLTQCEALGYRTGADVRLERFDLPPEDRFSPAAQEALFRIVQEALSNVARHARARTVSVAVRPDDDGITLSVRDDGQGFDTESMPHGTGLAGMRERAQDLGGNLEVESVPGRGTMVRVHIPLTRAPRVMPDSSGEDHVRAARRGAITFATLVEQVTVLLIFLAAPISTVLLGVGVAFVSWGRARLLATQIELRPGAGRPDDAQDAYLEDGLLAGALTLAGLCVFYLFVAEQGWRLQLRPWQVLGAVALVEALAATVTLRWYRGIDRYLRLLTASEQQRAADRRIRMIRYSLLVWGVVLVIALLAGFNLRFPPRTLSQWGDVSTVGVLIVWPLIDAADYLRTAWLRRRLPPLAM